MVLLAYLGSNAHEDVQLGLGHVFCRVKTLYYRKNGKKKNMFNFGHILMGYFPLFGI